MGCPEFGLLKEYRVPSFTDDQKIYRVQVFEDGTHVCDCPAFTFRPETHSECKHIQGVMRGDYTPVAPQDLGEYAIQHGFVSEVTVDPANRVILVPFISPGWPETGAFVLTIIHDLLKLRVAWQTLWERYGEWLFQGMTAVAVAEAVKANGRVVIRGDYNGIGNPYQQA